MLRSFAGGRIFGERTGDGTPQVLALHGWGRDHRDFDEVLRGLDAIAVDLPGFGSSPEPDQALGSYGYAEMVAAVLDGFDEPAVVVGHSFGGRVAIQLAVAQPHRVAALVLVGVPLLPRSGPARRAPVSYRFVRALHRAGLVGDDRMERNRRRHGSADYRAARGVMREVLVKAVNESYESQLAAIRQPVYLVWGADDGDVPPAVAKRAMDFLDDGYLTVLEGVSHHVCLEAPEAVRAAVFGVVS